jgi:hypothetical protein
MGDARVTPTARAAAATIAAALAPIRQHLDVLRAEAEAAALPSAATMSLQWLRDDTASALDTLQALQTPITF